MAVGADDSRNFRFSLADSFTYDDNIFRVPQSATELERLAGLGARREDYINRLSMGVDGKWTLARQEIDLRLRADDNRFEHNDELDYTSGNGRLRWRWQLGNNVSGEVGGDYDRSLTSFTNTRNLAKDLVETQAYFADGRYRLGPRWALKAGVRRAVTEHSDIARQFDNYESNSGNAAIEYTTPSANTFTLDYRYGEAEFPQSSFNSSGSERNYKDATVSLRTKYVLGAKTLFEGSVGYLERTYPDATNLADSDDFSGNIWHGSVRWQPSTKTQLKVSGWRELKAYVDAESDYFVAKGGSVAPAWTPTDKLSLSMEFSYEKQDYIGTSIVPIVTAGRDDKVTSERLVIGYQPRQWLQFGLSYRVEQRDSNRPLLEYDDKLATASIQVSL